MLRIKEERRGKSPKKEKFKWYEMLDDEDKAEMHVTREDQLEFARALERAREDKDKGKEKQWAAITTTTVPTSVVIDYNSMDTSVSYSIRRSSSYGVFLFMFFGSGYLWEGAVKLYLMLVVS